MVKNLVPTFLFFLDLLFVVVKERASGYLLCSRPLGKMVALVKIS